MSSDPPSEIHVYYCWDVLHAHLHEEDIPSGNHIASDEHYPLFITWKHKESEVLRGCIGLRDYSLIAALRDSRFEPVSKHELSNLSCTISLLVNFEITSMYDWEVGVHGIRLEFREPANNSKKSATYLPQVAQEQGWTKEQTLESLIKKAGYKGKLNEIKDVTIVRYQSRTCSAHWEEYVDWKSKSSANQNGRNNFKPVPLPRKQEKPPKSPRSNREAAYYIEPKNKPTMPPKENSILDRIMLDLDTLRTEDYDSPKSSMISSVLPENVQRLEEEIEQLKQEKMEMKSAFEQEKIRLLQQMQEIMHQNENLETKITAKAVVDDTRYEQLERRNSELLNQIDMLAAQAEVAEKSKQEILKRQSEISMLRSKEKALEEENKSLTRQLREHNDIVLRLKDEMKIVQDEITKYESEKRALKDEKEIVERQNKSLQEKIDLAELKSAEAMVELTRFQDENQHLQEELYQKSQKLTQKLDSEEKFQSINEELKRLKADRDSLYLTVQSYKSRVKPLEEENESLKQELREAKTKIKETESDSKIDDEELLREKEQWQTHINVLEDRLSEAHGEVEQLKDDNHSLKLTNKTLNDRLEDKDQVLIKIKAQYSKRIESIETELKEKSVALIRAEEELSTVKEQLAEAEKHIERIDPRLITSSIAPEILSNSLEELKEQLQVLQAERDMLLQSQQSMAERQVEQVEERNKMQQELEDMRMEMQGKIEQLERDNSELKQRRGVVGGKSENKEEELTRYRKQIQKMLVEHDSSEKEQSERISQLQLRLNESIKDLERVSKEKERLERESNFEKESLELRLKQVIEEKDNLIAEKERELYNLQNSHRIFREFRKVVRSRSSAGLSDIPEETIDKDVADLETHPIPKVDGMEKPQILHSDHQTMNGTSIHDLSRDPAMVGNPLDQPIDMSKFQLPHDYIMPHDPRLAQEDIYKLFASVQHLRGLILEKQGEIDRIRQENIQMKDDIKHIESVLTQDRENFDKVLTEWQDYAAYKEAEHSLLISERQETLTKLKYELEVAKEEWSRVVLQKEEMILHLIESNREVVKELYEESAIRVNRMQKVLEQHLQTSQEIEGTMMLVNLTKYRRENLAKEFFGDLETQVQKRFGKLRHFEGDDYVIPSMDDISITSRAQSQVSVASNTKEMFTSIRLRPVLLGLSAFTGLSIATSYLKKIHAEQLPSFMQTDEVEKRRQPVNLVDQKGLVMLGNNQYGLVDPKSPSEVVIKNPRRIATFDNLSFKNVAMGEKHAAAVDSHGNVYQWGAFTVGGDTFWPAHEPKLTLSNKNIIKVACDNTNVYALDSSGNVICMLADVEEEKKRREEAKKGAWFPSWVDGLKYLQCDRSKVVNIDTGDNHVVGLTAKGKVFFAASTPEGARYVARDNSSSSVNNFIIDNLAPTPFQMIPLEFDERIVQISSGCSHLLALSENQRVYGWGSNGFGQLGLGDLTPEAALFHTAPVEIRNVWNVPVDSDIPENMANAKAKITKVVAAGDTSFFIKDSAMASDVLACGFGQYGQLGYGSILHVASSPVRIKSLSFLNEFDESLNSNAPLRIADVIGGYRHAIAILDTRRSADGVEYGNDVLSWGSNINGECFLKQKSGFVASPTLMLPLNDDDEKGRFQIPFGRKKKSEEALVGISLGKAVTAIYSL